MEFELGNSYISYLYAKMIIDGVVTTVLVLGLMVFFYKMITWITKI